MMLKKIKYLFLLMTLLCYGQSSNFRFDHLTTQFQIVEDGLSANTVLCMIQDSRGFIWIGTYNGLDRYDGYSIKEYKNIEGDESSLSDNKIKSLCEDTDGNIWVGTWDGGLNKFIRDKEIFKRYLLTNIDSTPNTDNINAICQSDSGFLWIGTGGGGLSLLDIANDKVKYYRHDPDDPSSISDNAINAMMADKNGTLWIGTGKGGLNKFDPASGKFSSYIHEAGNPEGLNSNEVTSICEDDSGYLWIGTTGGGLNKFDRTRNKFTHYLHYADNDASISENNIWTVLKDNENNIWIGTPNSGINLFDRKNNRFTRIGNDFRNPDGLNNNSVYSILEDRSGILWFGTWSGGINKYDKLKGIFKIYTHNPDDKNSIGNNTVYAIYEDNYNEVWIGTDGGGMDRLNKNTNRFTHYVNDPGNPNSISDNTVYSICEDKDGYLWISTLWGGLNKFDRRTGKFTHYLHNSDDPNSISSNSVTQVYCDRQDNLWLGVKGGGIDKYVRGKNIFIHYKPDDNSKNSLSNQMVFAIYEDRQNNIWVGTNGGGLFKYDRKNDGFIRIMHDPRNPNKNFINVILQDRNGGFWIGTNAGIIKFNADKLDFKDYTQKQGLINNMVNGILEDNNGYLWISTNKGISRFNPANEKFTNYDVTSGLPGTEFNPWAYFKSPSGDMYFGGTNGLTVFNPANIKDNPHIPEIVITDFTLLHKTVPIGFDSLRGRAILEKPIMESDQIELSYDENVISFQISVLDYKNPHKNEFAYYLEGFDKNWNYKDASQRYVTYTNLSPGLYTLKVKGANSDGIWNRKGISLSIIINHPWWKTWWAYSFYIVIFAFIFTGSTRLYLNRKMLKNQLKLEHEHTKKLAEVDRIKSNFFTNISHEFRTPLTLIMGPSDKIISKSIDAEAVKQAETIKRNAGRLLRLINQLLDLSKLDERKLKLHATESNIVIFIKGIVMSFESFAERKDINLKVTSSRSEIRLFFDRDKMEKIVTNLLSNALKFTPRSGSVTVRIEEIENDSITIKISDTGIGIPEKEIPKLFDRFYQVDSSQTREQEGSGLGLSLTKELVELHHGTISVESRVCNPAAGKPGWTEFKIELPKGKYHLNEDEILKTPEADESGDIEEMEEVYSAVNNTNTSIESEDIQTDKTIILVVEDNKEVREYIRDFLLEDYSIEEAINGEQGVRKAKKIIPDLIISDVMMPKMDGNELTRILKNEETTSHIPIILLTAKTEKESRIAGLETGADDYMVKPFDTEELKIRIKNLVETRKKLQEKFIKGEFTPHRTDKHFGVLDQNFINKINSVIEKHLSEESFSIEEMGKEVSMSRSQVHRKLTALTGKSPSLYMRSLRLARARELIINRTANISEIAYSVGFSSPAYFTRCFKEEYGIPPSEIPNQYSN